MPSLRVVEWNAEGMFVAGSLTRRAAPDDALETLRMLDADIVIIPEFGVIDRLALSTKRALDELGYTLHTSTYRDPRVVGFGMAVLSRLEVLAVNEFSLGDDFRSGLSLTLQDAAGQRLRVIGVHLDDKSEASRLGEVMQLAREVNREDLPTVVGGDFNAMERASLLARLMRSRAAVALTRRLPQAQLRSIASRLHEMAAGTTIAYLLEKTPLHTLDPRRQPTVSGKQRGLEWLPALRIGKIDWLFGTHDFTARNYTVWRDVGSDHRPVVAELEY